MSYDYSKTINAEKGLIWRIVHRDNLPWILANGLHAGNSQTQSPSWVHIGNPELTDKRARHHVPVPPNGVLNDYVPFYFTPFSPMLRNISTGWGGITKRPNNEIVILVSSLPKLTEMGYPFVYTDSHAYYMWSNFYTDLADLKEVDWPLLQARDFKRDPNDPGKFERYQAEALVHGHCPVEALVGMICYDDKTKQQLDILVGQHGHTLDVHARPEWYF
jgi:hypothetical protein